MAIRVNDNGTVVIERVLKVTKELETSDLSSFEDNFNRMMHNYSEAFKTALSKRLEACEEAVATAKEIHSINESNIVYTSKEGYIRVYSFNAANAMNDLLTKLNEGKLVRIGDMTEFKCLQLLKAISRFPSPKWNNEEFEMIFSFLIAFADGSVLGVKNNDPEVKKAETYTVYVDEVSNLISFIKAIKETLHLGIREAKDIADKARKETHRIDNLSKEEAEKIAAEINEYGDKAVVEKN